MDLGLEMYMIVFGIYLVLEEKLRHLFFLTDEGDVCQEQRVLPNGRWPAELHGGPGGSLLAGHSAAPPAHREGRRRPQKKHPLTSTLRNSHDRYPKRIINLRAASCMTSSPYHTEWPVHISICWSAHNGSMIIWPDAEISGFHFSKFPPVCCGSKLPHPIGTWRH